MQERDALGGPWSGTPARRGSVLDSSAGDLRAPDFQAIFEAVAGRLAAHLLYARALRRARAPCRSARISGVPGSR
jgi:hypothetical protein